MTEHEEGYRRLRRLEQEWPRGAKDLHGLLRTLPAAQDPASDFDPGTIPPQLLSDVVALQEPIRNANVACRMFADVYQCALYLRINSEPYWSNDQGIRHVYRGQRKDLTSWPTVTRLYRARTTAEEVATAVGRLEALVDALIEEYPWFSEQQAVAVAQHYGGIADVDTWLLDVTSDPWVALFFASYGGERGDVGVVVRFSVGEWRDLLGDVAPINVVRVPRVLRIRNQRALFVDTPWPQLVEEYSPFVERFIQKPGVVFSDPSLGVSSDFLMSVEDDDVAAFVANWTQQDPGGPQGIVYPMTARPPHDDPLRDPPWSVYQKLAVGILERYLFNRDVIDQCSPMLEQIATFHALARRRIGPAAVSVHFLESAARDAAIVVKNGRSSPLEDLVDQYRAHSSEFKGELYDLAREVEDAWREGGTTWTRLVAEASA